MTDPERQELLKEIQKQMKTVTRGVIVLVVGTIMLVHYMLNPWQLEFNQKQEVTELPKYEQPAPEFENGIHLRTGLRQDPNIEVIIANCTTCHSAKMVTQNRATRDGWKAMITWMQETQNLWDLGTNEPLILDYLAKYYAPKKAGRRQPITNIDWYVLED